MVGQKSAQKVLRIFLHLLIIQAVALIVLGLLINDVRLFWTIF